MNKRKFFGTIIGLIFWSFCVIFFTYAYYDWRSDSTNVVLGIEDLSLECLVGADVEVSNIGPVLNYQDGVKVEFAINNAMTDSMTIELYLDITSISDNLLTESFKYVLVADSTGGTNYDYNNPILEGDFTNFNIGNNLVTQDLEVISENTTNYQFIIYIDGNMYNDPNMQENSLVGNLLIGKCSGDSIPYDELVYQAIYSETDNSLTFVHTTPLTVGDTYNDKAVTTVYTGFTTATYSSASYVPWYKDGNYQNITTVNFDSVIKPKSTAYWFYKFSNIEELDLSKLDTSITTSMADMFNGCSSLTSLNLDKWDTSKVTIISGMFQGCSSLTSLDVTNFDTSSVTSMNSIFKGCTNLTSLDVSNFNTIKVTDMRGMFSGCIGLTSLDLSNLNTSNVTIMGEFYNNGGMFQGCKNLTSLDLSSFDTSNVTNMQNMFRDCSSLEELNISSFDTSNATSLGGAYYSGGMFMGCSNLTSLDVSNFNTSKVTNMGGMFSGCSSLTNLDLSNFDTSNVTDMSGMFMGCSNLTSLDVSNFNTSNVRNMDFMFSGLKLKTLNLENFNTSKVTDMRNMFSTCDQMLILDLSNFNTSNVRDMQYMFQGCYKLMGLNLDLIKFDTSKVTNMNYMFHGCYNLSTIMTISNLNNTAYTNMFTYAANQGEALITVNYTTNTSQLVDDMIGNVYAGNVVKGICVDCVVEETPEEEIT